jgi:hypothetical protein
VLTFRLYLAEMSTTKKNAIKNIRSKQSVIFDHIMYLVLIDDKREYSGWIKEIINLISIIDKTTRLKPKNKRLHKDIYFEYLYTEIMIPLDNYTFNIHINEIKEKYNNKVYFKKYNKNVVEFVLYELFKNISISLSNNNFIYEKNIFKKELLNIANKELI